MQGESHVLSNADVSLIVWIGGKLCPI